MEVRNGRTEEWFVSPEELGIAAAPLETVAGGTPAENAAVIRGVIAEEKGGPARDVCLLNAGATIFVAGRADDLAGGVERAREGLNSGEAARVLERFTEMTLELGGASG